MVKSCKNNKIYITLVFIISVGFLCSCLFRPLASDYYHIMNSGRYIAEHQEIPQYNFEFVEDGYETIIQQWLYAVVLYEIGSYNVFLVGVFTAVQLIIVVLLMIRLATKYLGTSLKAGVLISLISAAFIQPYMNCRPEMFSIILLLVQCLCIERYKAKRKAAILYVLPVLSLIEINAHAMFWALHFVYLLPYIVPLNKIFRNKLRITDNEAPLLPFALPCALMFGTLFINPYGEKVISCLLGSSELEALQIEEMSAVNAISGFALFFIIELIILGYLYHKGVLNSTTVYMVIGSNLLMMIMVRNIIFVSIGTVYELSYLYRDEKVQKAQSFISHIEEKNKKEVAALPFVALFFCSLYTLYNAAVGDTTFLKGNAFDTTHTPKQAAEYLIANEPNLSDVRMFTEFNNGAYFLWNGVGRVYGTAKTEPFLKEVNGVKDIIKEFAFITYNAQKEDLDRFFEEYDFDYVIASCDSPSIQVYMETSPDYSCVLVSDAKTTANNETIPLYHLYKHIREKE